MTIEIRETPTPSGLIEYSLYIHDIHIAYFSGTRQVEIFNKEIDKIKNIRKPMPDTVGYAPNNQASKLAGQSIIKKLSHTRGRVYDLIKSMGPIGATGSEIAQKLHILPYTAKPRCTELRDAGYIYDAGTRENPNGQQETVWVAK